jgi:hypothetical protein
MANIFVNAIITAPNKYQIIFTTSIGEYNTEIFLRLNLGRRSINADKSAIE